MSAKQGFSLLEVLITMMIVAILAVVSYQLYNQHLVKVRRADAQLALVKLSSALENYYLQHNSYQGVNFTKLALPNKSPQGFYELAIELEQDNQAYLVKAIPIGVQAKQDQACGTLILATDGRRTYQGNDPKASCW